MAGILSTVTSKGQTTIPEPIRKALNLKQGQQLVYELSGNGFKVHPLPELPELFGILKSDKSFPSKAAIRQILATHAVRRQKAKISDKK